MAVLNLTADQLAPTFRRRPTDDHGKLRTYYGKVSPPAVAGDANSTAVFFKIPPAATRIWPHLSRIRFTAFGAGRTLKLGHKAYSSSVIGTTQFNNIVEDDDAFFTGLDLTAAGNVALPIPVTQIKFDIFARNEVEIFGTVAGGTWPTTGEIELLFVTTYE